MSRLDSFIRRLTAQRACLDEAARLIAGRPGAVLELGLGNGRTFDHLRTLLPERRIVVIERRPMPHPDCLPPAEDLLVDTFESVLAAPKGRLPQPIALVHADIGTGDAARNAALARVIGPLLSGVLGQGAVIAADQALDEPGFAALPLPQGVEPGRYHLYRVAA